MHQLIWRQCMPHLHLMDQVNFCACQHQESASPSGRLTCLGVLPASLWISCIQLRPYSMDLPLP